MDIRLTGTRDECAAFVRNMLDTMPEGTIRSISGWYQNKRKGYSTEGRVYIKLDDRVFGCLMKGTEIVDQGGRRP